jgi:hypothetical protein
MAGTETRKNPSDARGRCANPVHEPCAQQNGTNSTPRTVTITIIITCDVVVPAHRASLYNVIPSSGQKSITSVFVYVHVRNARCVYCIFTRTRIVYAETCAQAAVLRYGDVTQGGVHCRRVGGKTICNTRVRRPHSALGRASVMASGRRTRTQRNIRYV